VRERWFGATGRRVPEARLQEAHDQGVPVVVRAATPEAVRAALERPEVACVLVPPEQRELRDLDFRRLKYG
jgi:hypothetical protein